MKIEVASESGEGQDMVTYCVGGVTFNDEEGSWPFIDQGVENNCEITAMPSSNDFCDQC